MVKLKKIHTKLTTLMTRLSRRTIILILAAVLIAGGLAVYFINKQDNPASSISCVEANQQVKDTLPEAAKQENPYKTLYNDVSKDKPSCAPTKAGVTGSKAQGELEQIEFYYNKATIAYRVGKNDEAKQAANEALKINDKLKDSDKKLPNHAQLIKALEQVRDGTF